MDAGTEAMTGELRDRVLWVRFSRPDAMNAMNGESIGGLGSMVIRAAQDDVRTVVITGVGRAFCVGADLKALATTNGSLDPVGASEFVREASAVIEGIAALPKPVIAAVNGFALAGGLELVMACDIVIAARSARLGDAHSNYGLLPGGGGSVRLPRLVGPQLAKRMIFTGEFVPAPELLGTGLVTEVVDDEKLEERVAELAAQIAAKSPRVIRVLKALIDSNLESSIDLGVRHELAALSAHVHTEEFAEGLAAFREGRPPVFGDR